MIQFCLVCGCLTWWQTKSIKQSKIWHTQFCPIFYQKWMVTNHPRVGHCFFSARGAAPFHLHPFSRQAAKACAELFPPGFLTCGGCQLPMNATSTHGIPMGYCNSRKHGLVNHDSSTPSLGWAIGIYESTFGGHDILPCCHKLRCMISTRNCQHFSVCWLHLNTGRSNKNIFLASFCTLEMVISIWKYHLVIKQFAMENPPIFKNGQPSINLWAI